MPEDPQPTKPSPSPGARAAWIVWRIVRPFLIAYGVVCVLVWWFENSMTYFPTKYPGGEWNPEGLVVEDAHFESADGTRLHGWYVDAKEPSAVILFCHGNAGNITHRYELMRAVQLYIDASILVFDYRGFGKSEGAPHEKGVLADARAARAWLAQRANVAEQDIVLMGESIGGAIAIDLAAQDGARGLIVESTFTSLPDMAAYHYPWLPARWLMKGRLDSLRKIGDYQGPLLMFHGDADTIVPLEFGEKLFAAANEPKKLVIQPGGDHNGARGKEFYDELSAFLKTLE